MDDINIKILIILYYYIKDLYYIMQYNIRYIIFLIHNIISNFTSIFVITLNQTIRLNQLIQSEIQNIG